MGEQPNFKELLEGDLFSGNGNGKKKPFNTQVILKKQEDIRQKLKEQDRKSFKRFPVHLFPGHLKAPYLDKNGRFSEYEINIAYTAHYIYELKTDKKGEADCSAESLLERMYIALMARAKTRVEDKTMQDNAIQVFEDAIAPDIAERYGFDEEYVRKGLLPACVLAMEKAFQAKPRLLEIYEQTLAKNGRK
jgi:hypothetical protein